MGAKGETLSYACPRIFWSGSFTSRWRDVVIGLLIIAILLGAMAWGWLPHTGGSFELGLKLVIFVAMAAPSAWLIYSGLARRSTRSEINADGVCIDGKLWSWSRVTRIWGEYDNYRVQVTFLWWKSPRRVQIHAAATGFLETAVLLSDDPPDAAQFRALMRELEEFLSRDYPHVQIEHGIRPSS